MAKAKGYSFSQDGVKRIVSAVRKVEGTPKDMRGGRLGNPPQATPSFWIELLAESETTPGLYSWKKVVPSAGELVDTDPLIDSDDAFTALEISGTPGLAGKRAEVRFIGYDGDGAARYLFGAGSAAGLFPVDVTMDGGDAGDDATACSFTYTVSDLDSVELGTAMSPTWARPAAGAMVAATHGLGYYDAGGDFVLYQVDEQPDVVSCEVA